MNNNSHPFFSVIIPTLNEEKLLPLLLNDLTHQTFKDFEVIIVDGNSTDETINKAKKYSNKLNSLKIIPANVRNVSHQRNLGVKNATSDWLLFMDADNRIPSYLIQGIKYRLEKTNPDIFTLQILPDSDHKKDTAITKLVNFYMDIQKSTKNPSCLESMLGFKKTVFEKLGNFNEDLLWGEGGEILRKAAGKYRFEVIKDPKYTYSLRRLRTQGTLKLFRNVAQFELTRFIRKPLAQSKVAKLYPMKGGSFFSETTKPKTTLENILKELSQLPSISKEYLETPVRMPKKSTLKKLFSFFKK